MNGVPVANHGEDQQEKRDQQQAGSFGIGRMPGMLRGGRIMARGIDHTHIVRRTYDLHLGPARFLRLSSEPQAVLSHYSGNEVVLLRQIHKNTCCLVWHRKNGEVLQWESRELV